MHQFYIKPTTDIQTIKLIQKLNLFSLLFSTILIYITIPIKFRICKHKSNQIKTIFRQHFSTTFACVTTAIRFTPSWPTSWSPSTPTTKSPSCTKRHASSHTRGNRWAQCPHTFTPLLTKPFAIWKSWSSLSQSSFPANPEPEKPSQPNTFSSTCATATAWRPARWNKSCSTPTRSWKLSATQKRLATTTAPDSESLSKSTSTRSAKWPVVTSLTTYSKGLVWSVKVLRNEIITFFISFVQERRNNFGSNCNWEHRMTFATWTKDAPGTEKAKSLSQ